MYAYISSSLSLSSSCGECLEYIGIADDRLGRVAFGIKPPMRVRNVLRGDQRKTGWTHSRLLPALHDHARNRYDASIDSVGLEILVKQAGVVQRRTSRNTEAGSVRHGILSRDCRRKEQRTRLALEQAWQHDP